MSLLRTGHPLAKFILLIGLLPQKVQIGLKYCQCRGQCVAPIFSGRLSQIDAVFCIFFGFGRDFTIFQVCVYPFECKHCCYTGITIRSGITKLVPNKICPIVFRTKRGNFLFAAIHHLQQYVLVFLRLQNILPGIIVLPVVPCLNSCNFPCLPFAVHPILSLQTVQPFPFSYFHSQSG